MGEEAKYNIQNKLKYKISDIIDTNLKERNLKQLSRKGNNANHEDHGGIHLSTIQSLPLSSLSGSLPVMSDGVQVWF